MKKRCSVLVIAVAFSACLPSTKITASWKNPKSGEKTYSSVMVASLTHDNIAKAIVETDLAKALGKSGITVSKSMDEFPSGFKADKNGQDTVKEVILNKVRDKNIDGILTVSLIDKETKTRYVPGSYGYNPMMYGYYGTFGGYYGFWYPYGYSPGYYTEDKVYYIETNFYDAKTDVLLWSAQSETYNPASLANFSKELAELIVAKMKSDGVLKATHDSSDRDLN